jgi:hypothetical protein
MIWLLFIIGEILRNFVMIKWLKWRPHYGYSALIRFAAGATCLFKEHPEFDPLGDVTTIFPAVTYGLFQWTSFYLLFDLTLNKLRGLPWDYKGKNSGMTDSLPETKYYLLKAGSLVVLVLTLFVIWK